jgi:hypothetical protein
VQDLLSKRIGVPGMGTPPFIFANRVLGANGIDPSKEITCRVFPAGEPLINSGLLGDRENQNSENGHMTCTLRSPAAWGSFGRPRA